MRSNVSNVQQPVEIGNVQTFLVQNLIHSYLRRETLDKSIDDFENRQIDINIYSPSNTEKLAWKDAKLSKVFFFDTDEAPPPERIRSLPNP